MNSDQGKFRPSLKRIASLFLFKERNEIKHIGTNNQNLEISNRKIPMSLLTLLGLLDPLNISNNANATDSPFQYFDEYIARGSGWTLKRILHKEVYTMQHRPIWGSSYFSLPDALSGSLRFHSFPVVDWFCLFIYLWVLTFPL
jgi:hypothetical protein